MTIQLNVRALSYQIHTKTLVKSIDLQLNSGELVGIIGPNGAGKSTLLKSLVGILPAQYQTLDVAGKSLAAYSHRERAQQISYLAQHHDNQFPFLANDVIGLGAFAQSSGASSKKITAIAIELGIENLLNRKMTDLSGGEQQLVHFARLMMQKTPVALLDEPTASLDIGHEAQLMSCLKKRCLQKQTALVAMHNLNTAAAFCDRLILMNQGSIIATGKPEQVLKQDLLSKIYHHPVIVSTNTKTGTLTVLPANQIDF